MGRKLKDLRVSHGVELKHFFCSNLPEGVYLKTIKNMKLKKVKMETPICNFTATLFSLSTHIEISGAFNVIHRMFSSISAIISLTESPAVVVKLTKLVRWA